MKKIVLLLVALSALILIGAKTASAFFVWGGEPVLVECYHADWDPNTDDEYFMGVVVLGQHCTDLLDIPEIKEKFDFQHATGREDENSTVFKINLLDKNMAISGGFPQHIIDAAEVHVSTHGSAPATDDPASHHCRFYGPHVL